MLQHITDITIFTHIQLIIFNEETRAAYHIPTITILDLDIITHKWRM